MRPVSAVIFDLDGTLVRYRDVDFESSWGAIAHAAGVSDRSSALLRTYFHRKDAYAEWVAQDAALLAGIEVEQVLRHVLPAPYAAGVVAAMARLRGKHRLGILSSGVDLIANWVKEDLGLEFAVANRVLSEAGRFTGLSETRVDLWGKDRALRALAVEQGLRLRDICFVGDHINDIPAMKIAGLAVAANPKDAQVQRVADFVISDFEELPDLVDEWTTKRRGNGA